MVNGDVPSSCKKFTKIHGIVVAVGICGTVFFVELFSECFFLLTWIFLEFSHDCFKQSYNRLLTIKSKFPAILIHRRSYFQSDHFC